MTVQSALEGCIEYGRQTGRELDVGCEKFDRTDVHATDNGVLVVAFESASAGWHYKPSLEKNTVEKTSKSCATRNASFASC